MNKGSSTLTWIGVLLIGVGGIIGLGLFWRYGLIEPAKERLEMKKQGIECINHLKMLGVAAQRYAQEKGSLPRADSWCDALKPYFGDGEKVDSLFACPARPAGNDGFYTFNAGLSGVKIHEIRYPSITVLFFDGPGGLNGSGGLADLPAKGPHNGAVALGFVDGHVEIRRMDHLGGLKWEPSGKD
jgi:prepilin-type processing-associated H-X9-DG protein